jgi:DNA-binding PadR family transcriptional regulator
MSRTTSGLSAGDALLGLLIEQPDHGYSLARRLRERFGAAQFVHSSTYSALDRLEKKGMIRVVDASSSDKNETVYEATPKGAEHFRQWLRASDGAPVLRDELHAKIALSGPRDLPRLIDLVHSEELACIAQLESIRQRLLEERRNTRPRALAEQEWSPLVERGISRAEADFWGGRIQQLAQLRTYLEELRGEAERRALAEHSGAALKNQRAR